MPALTVQQHIIDEQQRFPHASGEFSFLLSGITMACKTIQAKVRRAGITDILGSIGTENVQGEATFLWMCGVRCWYNEKDYRQAMVHFEESLDTILWDDGDDFTGGDSSRGTRFNGSRGVRNH